MKWKQRSVVTSAGQLNILTQPAKKAFVASTYVKQGIGMARSQRVNRSTQVSM